MQRSAEVVVWSTIIEPSLRFSRAPSFLQMISRTSRSFPTQRMRISDFSETSFIELQKFPENSEAQFSAFSDDLLKTDTLYFFDK